MIRRWLITLALVIAVPLLTAAVHFRPRPVPLDECSELYRRYADNPDIRAAYVSNYRVNDTLTLCATLLEAANDTGWAVLYDTFHLTLHKRPDYLTLQNNEDDIWEILHVPGYGDNVIGVASHRGKYLLFLHVDNPSVKDAIFDKLFYMILTQQTV